MNMRPWSVSFPRRDPGLLCILPLLFRTDKRKKSWSSNDGKSSSSKMQNFAVGVRNNNSAYANVSENDIVGFLTGTAPPRRITAHRV
jgi:hypothetical protein